MRGGSVDKKISSLDILDGLGPVEFNADAVADRNQLLARLKADAKPGDCIIIMGARDPSLSALVKNTVGLFGGKSL